MSQSVDPILLDSTGQAIVTALNLIANKTVDSALSTTSANPVQNKVITGEINGIKEKIPSGASSSNKMATANDITGVQNAVKANTGLISDTVGFSGKNLIYIPAKTVLEKCTVDANGVVTINGTLDSAANFMLIGNSGANTGVPIADYSNAIKSGNIISAGLADNSTHWLLLVYRDSNNAFISEQQVKGDTVITVPNGSVYFQIKTYTPAGTYNNAKLYPMIRKANILDSTYEPYHPSVVNTLMDAEVIESRNKCDISNAVKATNFISDVDSDGTIHFKDISSIAWTSTYLAKLELKENGEYIISSDVNLTYGRIAMNLSPTAIPATANKPDITIHTSGINYGEMLGKYVGKASFKSNANQTVYLWFCNDSNNASHAAFNAKIMVRDASETDPTYKPYYIPLKDSMFPRDEQRVLGAKNLNSYPYFSQNETQQGITFSDNNGILTLTGLATADAYFNMHVRNYDAAKLILPNGRYILSGCPNFNGVKLIAYCTKNGSAFNLGEDIGNGVAITLNGDDNYTDKVQLQLTVFVAKNTDISTPVICKPMLRLATDPDDTYVPYAMTNKELTERVGKTLISSDDLNDIKDAGIYAFDSAPTNSPLSPSSSPEEYSGMIVMKNGSSGFITQVVFRATGSRANMYIRAYSGSWLPWFKFTGEAIS